MIDRKLKPLDSNLLHKTAVDIDFKGFHYISLAWQYG